MPEITYKTVFDILLESLKIQAEKYKALIQADLTHEQRKEFDSEIKQMYDLLSNMTNSTIVLSSAEIETLKTQFEKKLQEFQLILDNPNLTLVKGDKGEKGDSGLQGIQGEKGDKGDTGLQGIQGEKGDTGLQGIQGIQGEKGEKGETGLQGQNGIDGTHGLDGDDGLSAYQIALNNGFVGSETEWLQSLKGATGEKGLDGQNGIDGKDGQDGVVTFESLNPQQIALLKGEKGEKGETGIQGIQGEKGETGLQGSSLTYHSLTPEEKQELANLVPVSGGGSSVSNIACITFSGRQLMIDGAYTHLKTRIKYVDFLFANMQVSYFSHTNAFHSSSTFQLIPSFPVGSLRFSKTLGTLDASIVLTPYVSFDGYMCFVLSTFADSFYLDLCIDIRLKDAYDLSTSLVAASVKTNSASSQFAS